jgi:hypothetical protein
MLITMEQESGAFLETLPGRYEAVLPIDPVTDSERDNG